MEVGKLTVQRRYNTGKGVARKLRSQAKIPGVCYGFGLTEPLPIAVDPRAFRASLDPVKRHNSVIEVTIEESGKPSQTLTVMVKDYQYHRIRRELSHLDLIAIDQNKEVDVTVPLEFTGKAKGLINNGQLHIVLRNVGVRCRPANIPSHLTVDVTELDIGGVIHLNDLKLPEGVSVPSHINLAIVTCVAAEVATAAETGGEAAAAAAPAATK